METLDFPQIMFCTSQGFKAQVLTDMGLREDSLSFAQFITHQEDFNLTDIETLWVEGELGKSARLNQLIPTDRTTPAKIG